MVHMDPNLSQLTLTVGLELPGNTNYSAEAVKAAWISARAESPVIACTVVNEGMQYQVPTEDELIEWAEATVSIDRSGRNGREMATTTTMPESTTLYFFPEAREIAINARHELCDSIALLLLANTVLKHLRTGSGSSDMYKIGEEVARLPSSAFRSVDGQDSLSSEGIAKAHHTVNQYLDKSATTLMTPTRLAEIRGATPYLPQGRFEHQFSEAESATIFKICRAKGITLTAAIWAAYAQAVLEYSGKNAGNVACSIPINVRGRFQGRPQDRATGNGNISNQAIISAYTNRFVDTNTDFIGWAKDSQRELGGWRNREDSLQIFQYLSGVLKEQIATDLKAGIVYPTSLFISNVGVSEDYITEPINDVWFNAMISTAWNTGILILTTHGKIRLETFYNRAFHHEGEIGNFMNMLVGHLRKGLGVVVVPDRGFGGVDPSFRENEKFLRISCRL
ncbi:hypothetical protein TWF718_000417 [Orbilia javanica]|uniref:Uncharacterized protein n=1 Tax=Orbilia javanica TaxID=47235 RepID=A0AAN8MZN9_9PEZI